MKILIVTVFSAGALVAAAFYMNRSPSRPGPIPSEPVVDPGPSAEAAPVAEPARTQPQTYTSSPAKPAQIKLDTTSPTPTKASLDSVRVNQLVDTVVSPQASYAQKQAAWKQLREQGQLDRAISELEQRAGSDPRSADIPAALGQAYLKKCGVIQDVREQGILAMQADKVFDTALSLDPENWEARFTKAVALSYWPANLNRSGDVIQLFETLLQQQEAQAPQPQFGETYAWLGEQYKKAGRIDDARAIWLRGTDLFPDNESLRNKLAAQQ